MNKSSKIPRLTNEEAIEVDRWLAMSELKQGYYCPFSRASLCRVSQPYTVCRVYFPLVVSECLCPCVCYTQDHVIEVAKGMLKGVMITH
mgnify:CR=1 FL=1